MLVACATAASLFPYLGTVVYTILRPPEYLEDREERELELRAAELELRQRIENSCPHCEYPIERSYLRCPNCERRLRNPCRKCGKPLDPKWGVCPYCETEVRKERARPRAAAHRAPANGTGRRAAIRAERKRPQRPVRQRRQGGPGRPERAPTGATARLAARRDPLRLARSGRAARAAPAAAALQPRTILQAARALRSARIVFAAAAPSRSEIRCRHVARNEAIAWQRRC